MDTLYPLQKVGTAISQMRDSFPSVSVRVQVEPLGGPLEALRQKSCALAVMVGEDFRDPRIKFDALTSIIQVAVVAAEHPLAKDKGARALEALDLADHLQIVLTDPPRYRPDVTLACYRRKPAA